MSTLESYEIPSEMVKFMSGEVSRRNSDVSKFPGDQKPQTGNNGGLSAGEHFILFNVKASEVLSEVKTGESEDTREIVDPQSRIRDFLYRGNLTRENLENSGNRCLSNEEMIEALSTYMECQMTALQRRLDPTVDRDLYPGRQKLFADSLINFRQYRQNTLDSLSKATSDAGGNELVDSWIEYAKLWYTHEMDAEAIGLLRSFHNPDSPSEAAKAVESADTTVTEDSQSHIQKRPQLGDLTSENLQVFGNRRLSNEKKVDSWIEDVKLEDVKLQSHIRDLLDRGSLTRENLQTFDNRRLSNEEMIKALSTYREHQFTAQTQRQMTALQGWLKLDHTRYSELQRNFNENLDELSQFREFRQKTLDSLSKVTSDAGRNRLVDSWIEYAKLCHEAEADAGLSGLLHNLDSPSQR